MPNTEKTFALKIINDLEKAITTFTNANSFEILPLGWNDYNLSPVCERLDSVALDLWAVKIIVPYAHRKLLENKLEKPVDIDVLRPCLLTLNLLHPELPTAWNTRRELVVLKNLSTENDLHLTKLVLSRSPNCNEPLSYRRWLLRNNLVKGERDDILSTELSLIQKSADKHHCNFHAWSHWSWCLKHFCPLDKSEVPGRNEESLLSYKDFKLLFETTQFYFFYDKLKVNTTYVTKHVTDYSSIFQRIHLIENLFKIVENGVTKIKDDLNVDEDHEIVEFVEAVHDVNLDTTDSDDEEKTAFDIYKHLEQPILEILRFCEDECIKKYVGQNKINVKLGILLKELRWNDKLINVFEDIEAILYYRRFLILSFKKFLFVQSSSLKSVLKKLYDSVIVFEKACVDMLAKDNLRYHSRSVNNYNSWLKKIIFKDDCNPFD